MLRIALHGLLLTAFLVAGRLAASPQASPRSPFAFFAPSVALEPADRAMLEGGKPIAKVLQARDRELGVFAAVRIEAPGERLIAWTRHIAELQQGRYVPAIARFSDPPRLADLDALTLSDEDLDDIRQCRPGDCGVKLSAAEMTELQRHIDVRVDWRSDVQHAFRRLILARARGYLLAGDSAIPPYHDESEPMAADTEFTSLMQRLGFMTRHLPDLAEFLQQYPRIDDPAVVDSFLYWSTENLGVKPIISVTHVSLTRGGDPRLPEVVSVSKQVFATHYRNGSVSVTAIVGDAESGRYLVYLHRAHVDVLQGVFASLVRRIIERRVRDEAPDVLNALRRRLERGDPP